MSDGTFDLDAWLRRIGHDGPRAPGLATLRAVITAHSTTIPFENIDVLLGRTPKLDLGSLQRKLVTGGRGGYCFEQNAILRAGLLGLGFTVTSLIGRVIRGLSADAERPAGHMILRVDLPEGSFLADVGFGNLTPTAPLVLRPHVEQATPHEVMRFLPVGDELTLQARFGEVWENIYRVSLHPRLNIDYEVANLFTATHPASPFVGNLIVARPGPDGARHTLFNGRVSARRRDGRVERHMLEDAAAYQPVLAGTFGLTLSDADLNGAVAALERAGTRGGTHPSFA